MVNLDSPEGNNQISPEWKSKIVLMIKNSNKNGIIPVHDTSHLQPAAQCRAFLKTSDCQNCTTARLSHVLSFEKVPHTGWRSRPPDGGFAMSTMTYGRVWPCER